jgi:hypothetical protein
MEGILVSRPVGPELALGMALALESSEVDLERVRTLLHDLVDPEASRELALQLLARARRRLETVRSALGEAGGSFPF